MKINKTVRWIISTILMCISLGLLSGGKAIDLVYSMIPFTMAVLVMMPIITKEEN